MHPDLQTLLLKRLEVIADRDFYERDPSGHLAALKDVSEKITAYNETQNEALDAKMRHYLTNSSFQKALDHLKKHE